jgi:hypothetical protein
MGDFYNGYFDGRRRETGRADRGDRSYGEYHARNRDNFAADLFVLDSGGGSGGGGVLRRRCLPVAKKTGSDEKNGTENDDATGSNQENQ